METKAKRIRAALPQAAKRVWNLSNEVRGHQFPTGKSIAIAVLLVLIPGLVAGGIALTSRTGDPNSQIGGAVGDRVVMPKRTTTTTTTTAPPTTTARPKKSAPKPTTTATPTTAAPLPSQATTPPTVVDLGEALGEAAPDTGVESWPGGCCAPLTGLGFDRPEYATRLPIAVKVSNSPSADPQTGLVRSDLIYEIKVEGFTRLIAVFQSRDVGDVGPIRSGRTSDPPILHGLGKPMVVNSGGNQFVLDTFAKAQADGWLVNLPRGGDAYYRSSRVAPHNFYVRPNTFWSTRSDGLPVVPQFQFLSGNDTNPAAARVNSVSVKINRVESSFTWDSSTGFFLRNQYGRKHSDLPTGKRVARASVIILATPYGISGADARSPEAITTWVGGEAWVFTGGTYIHGRWVRGETNDTFHLVDDSERPIKLYGGPVWITLTDTAPQIG